MDGLKKENADKLVEFLKQKAKPSVRRLEPGGPVKPEAQSPLPDSSPSSFAPSPPPSPATPPPSDAPLYSRANVPISPSLAMSEFLTLTCLLPIGLLLLGWFLGMDIFRGGRGILWLRGIGILIPLILLYCYIDYKNFKFQLWNDHGEVFHKVIAQSTTYFYYDRIQNVNLSQGIMNRLFDIYTLGIETAAGSGLASTILVGGLNRKDAEKLRDFLLGQAKAYGGIL